MELRLSLLKYFRSGGGGVGVVKLRLKLTSAKFEVEVEDELCKKTIHEHTILCRAKRMFVSLSMSF